MQQKSDKRTPLHNSMPVKGDGKDGDTRFVMDKGVLYFMKNVNGEWYKTKMDKT